jgi:uncharacterized protein YlxP (DUF503 family)
VQQSTSNLYVAVARLELHIPEARSLKEKRSATRSLVQRLRSRHQVLVTESDQQGLYQRATIAICAMSTDTVDLEARMQRVSKMVDETWSGHILSWEMEILQV